MWWRRGAALCLANTNYSSMHNSWAIKERIPFIRATKFIPREMTNRLIADSPRALETTYVRTISTILLDKAMARKLFFDQDALILLARSKSGPFIQKRAAVVSILLPQLQDQIPNAKYFCAPFQTCQISSFTPYVYLFFTFSCPHS